MYYVIEELILVFKWVLILTREEKRCVSGPEVESGAFTGAPKQ